ncbi:ATP-binding protein, partial [bacterium]|nr:ATP-binding protein [bacterium]
STGSGKTNLTTKMLYDLYRVGCPFIVIECANRNYRQIKTFKNPMRDFADAVQIFSLGDRQVSPLRFNPLRRLPFETTSETVERVKTILLASLPVGGPLPGLLHKILYMVYENFPDFDNPSQLHDLREAVNLVMQKSGGYTGELEVNLKAALFNRIDSLSLGPSGEMAKTKHNYPDIASLSESFSVIELEGLAEDSKCLVLLFTLTELVSYFKNTPTQNIPARASKFPRFVLFIEEAHSVLGGDIRDAHLSEDNPNIQAHSTKLMVGMIKELRAYGVGVVIVDQSATAISEDVFRETTSKFVFRQNQDEDRNFICRSILLPELFTDELGRLNPGECY